MGVGIWPKQKKEVFGGLARLRRVKTDWENLHLARRLTSNCKCGLSPATNVKKNIKIVAYTCRKTRLNDRWQSSPRTAISYEGLDNSRRQLCVELDSAIAPLNAGAVWPRGAASDEMLLCSSLARGVDGKRCEGEALMALSFQRLSPHGPRCVASRPVAPCRSDWPSTCLGLTGAEWQH